MSDTPRVPWYGRPSFVKALGVAIATVVVAFGGWTFFGGSTPTTVAPTTGASTVPATADPGPPIYPYVWIPPDSSVAIPLPLLPVLLFDLDAYDIGELCHATESRGLHDHQCPCDIDLETMFPGDCVEFAEYLR